jgi:hypothetical protein
MRSFVPVGATARHKCPLIEAQQGLLLLTRYKCDVLTFIHLYRAEPPPGINVVTFIPVEKET